MPDPARGYATPSTERAVSKPFWVDEVAQLVLSRWLVEADHAAPGNKIKTQTNRWRKRIGSLPR